MLFCEIFLRFATNDILQKFMPIRIAQNFTNIYKHLRLEYTKERILLYTILLEDAQGILAKSTIEIAISSAKTTRTKLSKPVTWCEE